MRITLETELRSTGIKRGIGLQRLFCSKMLSQKRSEPLKLDKLRGYFKAVGYQIRLYLNMVPWLGYQIIKNCEFGRDDYSLNIICPPEYEEDCDD